MAGFESQCDCGDLYVVSVWVPTRGWVPVNEFWDFSDALALALSLEPLQVEIRHGEVYWSGGRYMTFDKTDQRPYRNIPADPTSQYVLDTDSAEPPTAPAAV